jgi:hypothetical protein
MNRFRVRAGQVSIALAILFCSLRGVHAQNQCCADQFEVELPSSLPGPITGRVFIMVSATDRPEPRLDAGTWYSRTEIMGEDVDQLRPGESVVLDSNTHAYPLPRLQDLPAGDYFIQALLNVYTQFHRADGRTIWAHADHWEGQQFNRAPGNLYSPVLRVHLDPRKAYKGKLSLTNQIPPVGLPADTLYVKHMKIQSKLLTDFWRQPVYLGATILLPEGYDSHPNVNYPVLYEQGHFTLRPPLGFSTEPPADPNALEGELRWSGEISGFDFYKQWISPGFPRMIVVTFQHPTVFFDDSYAVNSANNGPYGDAIMKELIPYIESHFRIIRTAYARLLSGGSTGGWESLALQIYHPEFFGGTWSFYPDPVDFVRYQLVDVYHDPSAFEAPGYAPPIPERPMERTVEGLVDVTMRQMSQLEDVLGTHGRSGQQYEAWESIYGPVGDDGYPKPLWDKRTGAIDHDVAAYMKDHGYDLRAYLEQHWAEIGQNLVGKLHVYCGDMDNFFLNSAVARLEAFLKSTTNPPYAGEFGYGRPFKGHGWHPLNQAELLRTMSEYVTAHSSHGTDFSWKY